MRYIVLPHRANTVIKAFVFTRGAIDEPKGKEGLAHLAEHCVMHAVRDRGPWMKMTTNAFTNYHWTAYGAETVPRFRDRAENFLQNVKKARISESIFRQEVGVVKSEIGRMLNSPTMRLSRVQLPQSGFEGRRGIPVMGTVESVDDLSVDDVNDWIEAYPPEISLEYKANAREIITLRKNRAHVEYVRKNVESTANVRGYYGAIVWTAPITPAIRLLVGYLGASGSETWAALRRTGQYAPRFNYIIEPLPRILVYFQTYAPLPSEDALEDAFQTVLGAMEKITEGEIDKELLEHVRTTIEIGLEHRVPSLSTVPKDLAHLAAVGQTYEDFTRAATENTPEDLVAVAQGLDRPRFVKMVPGEGDEIERK